MSRGRFKGTFTVVRTALALAVPAVLPRDVMAQPSLRIQHEVRLDVITSPAAVHAGVGATVPLGTYVRAGLIGGLGAGSGALDARTDLIGRFHLDPFRERRWAPYAGGGVSVRYSGEDDEATRGYLLVFIGMEGPVSRRGWSPAIEAGLGGGARIGVALRRGIPGRR